MVSPSAPFSSPSPSPSLYCPSEHEVECWAPGAGWTEQGWKLVSPFVTRVELGWGEQAQFGGVRPEWDPPGMTMYWQG